MSSNVSEDIVHADIWMCLLACFNKPTYELIIIEAKDELMI